MEFAHGIFSGDKAYTRSSIYDYELNEATPDKWKAREEKRLKRALEAAERGIEISEKYLKLRDEPTLTELNLPDQFMLLLEHSFDIRNEDGVIFQQDVEFTIAKNETAAVLRITHPKDNFDKRLGRKYARILLSKATGKLLKRKVFLDNDFVHYF